MVASQMEKAFCMIVFAKTNSVTLMQHHFRTRYGKQSPTRQSVYDWSKKFNETGCLGRPPVSEETVTRGRETYTRSPKKSTTRSNLELQVAQKTVWNILHKQL
jgi:hypothetical protein